MRGVKFMVHIIRYNKKTLSHQYNCLERRMYMSVYVCCFGSVEVEEEAKNITPFVNVLMSS